MGYKTAQEILSRAAVRLGLGEQSEPYGSTDQNIIQLRGMLADAGQDLIREHEWAHLRTQYEFITTSGEDTYTLPADFNRWVNQTQWNRTSKLPLGGPVTPQGWQLLKTLNVVAAVQMFFRTEGSNIILHPEPSGAFTIALEYVSEYWVSDDGGTTRNSATPAADNDVLMLDAQVLIHRLRRDWQEAKGFDSTSASNAYEAALSFAKGQTEASPILNLHHSPYNRARFLDGSNVPPTGFGGT